MFQRTRKKRSAQGMTLIEASAALVLVAIAVAAVTGVFSRVQKIRRLKELVPFATNVLDDVYRYREVFPMQVPTFDDMMAMDSISDAYKQNATSASPFFQTPLQDNVSKLYVVGPFTDKSSTVKGGLMVVISAVSAEVCKQLMEVDNRGIVGIVALPVDAADNKKTTLTGSAMDLKPTHVTDVKEIASYISGLKKHCIDNASAKTPKLTTVGYVFQ